MLKRKAQVAVKLETTEGTAVAVGAADAGMYVMEASFTPDIQRVPRSPLRSTLSNLPDYIGKKGAQLQFKTELVGSGAAGTAPAIAAALQACGLAETVVASTSVTYTPDSDAGEGDGTSASVGFFLDGKRLTLFGARATFEIELKAGEPGYITFTFTGVYGGVTDTALLSGITFPTPTPATWLGETMTLGGVSLIVDALGMSAGNNVSLRSDVTQAEGYRAAAITERAPTITLDPEEVLGATRDDYSNMEDGTLLALVASLTGSAGNILTINAPQAAVTDVGQNDRDGVATNDLSLQLVSTASAGDDEFTLVFT